MGCDIDADGTLRVIRGSDPVVRGATPTCVGWRDEEPLTGGARWLRGLSAPLDRLPYLARLDVPR